MSSHPLFSVAYPFVSPHPPLYPSVSEHAGAKETLENEFPHAKALHVRAVAPVLGDILRWVTGGTVVGRVLQCCVLRAASRAMLLSASSECVRVSVHIGTFVRP